LAGFELTLIGRFWVTAEESQAMARKEDQQKEAFGLLSEEELSL